MPSACRRYSSRGNIHMPSATPGSHSAASATPHQHARLPPLVMARQATSQPRRRIRQQRTHEPPLPIRQICGRFCHMTPLENILVQNYDGNAVPVLFIACAGRSGSTLLDRVIGMQDDFFSAGELRFIWERSFGENQLCGCGAPFDECAFWGRCRVPRLARRLLRSMPRFRFACVGPSTKSDMLRG